jgi:hypothetical protein
VSSIILNITFDCADPRALARFWGQVTGWPVVEEPRPGYEESAVGMAGEGRPRLYFVKVPDQPQPSDAAGQPRIQDASEAHPAGPAIAGGDRGQAEQASG